MHAHNPIKVTSHCRALYFTIHPSNIMALKPTAEKNINDTKLYLLLLKGEDY